MKVSRRDRPTNQLVRTTAARPTWRSRLSKSCKCDSSEVQSPAGAAGMLRLPLCVCVCGTTTERISAKVKKGRIRFRSKRTSWGARYRLLHTDQSAVCAVCSVRWSDSLCPCQLNFSCWVIFSCCCRWEKQTRLFFGCCLESGDIRTVLTDLL